MTVLLQVILVPMAGYGFAPRTSLCDALFMIVLAASMIPQQVADPALWCFSQSGPLGQSLGFGTAPDCYSLQHIYHEAVLYYYAGRV